MVRFQDTRLSPALADLHCAVIPAAVRGARSQTPFTRKLCLLLRFHLLCALSGHRQPTSMHRSLNGSRFPLLAALHMAASAACSSAPSQTPTAACTRLLLRYHMPPASSGPWQPTSKV